MDMQPQIAILDELGDDEDAAIRTWCATQANEEADVGMPTLLHETPFSLEVFGDIVIFGWQDFFYCNLNPEVHA